MDIAAIALEHYAAHLARNIEHLGSKGSLLAAAIFQPNLLAFLI
jgi:hypothetical protein